MCPTRVLAYSLRASDCLGDVWNDPITPAANLVTKDPKAPCPARSDCAFRNDTAFGPVGIANWGLLDHEPSLRHVYDERGVIEIAGRPAPQSCCDRLVDATVEPHRMTTRAQRQPVEIDTGRGHPMPSALAVIQLIKTQSAIVGRSISSAFSIAASAIARS